MANSDIKHSVNSATPQRIPPRRKAVDLSFDNHISLGEWIYKSALALVVVFVALLGLILAILFAAFSIEKREIPTDVPIEVAAPPIEEQATEEKQPMDEVQELEEYMQEQMKKHQQEGIKNAQSNEAAQDEGGSPGSVFDQEVRDMMEQHDKTLAGDNNNSPTGDDLTSISGSARGRGNGSGGEGEGSGGGKGDGNGDKKFNGKSLVSYKFENPTRTARGQLYPPGYRAEHSGTVVIEVYIDRNGNVNVNRTRVLTSSGNRQLDKEALNAAESELTIFNIDSSAPMEQRGTITYEFVAQ